MSLSNQHIKKPLKLKSKSEYSWVDFGEINLKKYFI